MFRLNQSLPLTQRGLPDHLLGQFEMLCQDLGELLGIHRTARLTCRIRRITAAK
jgi:hypothetical protein